MAQLRELGLELHLEDVFAHPKQGPNSSRRRNTVISLSVACMAVHGGAHPSRRSGAQPQCDASLPSSASPAVWAHLLNSVPSPRHQCICPLASDVHVSALALGGRLPRVAEAGMWA